MSDTSDLNQNQELLTDGQIDAPADAGADSVADVTPAAGGVAPAAPQASLARQQQRVDEENLKKESEELNLSPVKLMRLYALPLIVITIFAAIVFTLVIPGISQIFTKLGEADRLDEQVSNLGLRLGELESLSQNITTIESDLEAIEAIIPERVTQVVNFQQKITRIAKQNFNLRVTQAETGETLLSSAVESPDNPAAEALAIIEIPSTFSMSGTLTNIQGFISAIQQTDDFIIIGEMELVSNSNSDDVPISQLDSGQWRLDITLIKYQFPVPNANNNLEEIYAQVPPGVEINQNVLQYVKNKISLGTVDQLLSQPNSNQ